MKRYFILTGIAVALSFLFACSNNELDMEVLASEYETKIEEKNGEINKLKEELRLTKDELKQEKEKLEESSVDLQIYDHKARRIMSLITEKDFDKLANEFNVDFEVSDESLVFNKLRDYPTAPAFPIAIAGLPMYFAYYNHQPEFTEVGYFLYDSERKYDIHFHFGKNKEFEYVSSE
ncbi:hypothetical protein IMZ08_18050 [Bacillus luteolus]|uniref:Lipoprotein n=1 Tax=Litchfieldia luteola TaxID=682179 RepID=A0ABR9QN88_9BACI|nr:hypothetical protein [Cytobacillus luteolus]MBE4909942.1 hypothetical protein [Cytobacillus luteolus]MBP1942502.1 hypothetical protein [Cytobacillus luteolus]